MSMFRPVSKRAEVHAVAAGNMLSCRARYIMAMARMRNRIQRKAERHDQEHGS